MTTTTVHIDGRTVEVTPLPRRVGLDVTDYVHGEAITVLLPFADAARIAAALDPDRGEQWTRDDLPVASHAADGMAGTLTYGMVESILEAVASHLNKYHPKPGGGVQQSAGNPYGVAVKDHALVDWPATCAQEATRANAAEREVTRLRGTGAVTKADIEKAIRGAVSGPSDLIDLQTDAVWALVSGDDPAVHVVRESDIANVAVVKHDVNEWEADGKYAPHADSVAARKGAAEWLSMATRCEAVARAIEAEQAVDPVEGKARELYEAYHGQSRAEPWLTLNDVGREKFTRLAAHVLGQEASSDE